MFFPFARERYDVATQSSAYSCKGQEIARTLANAARPVQPALDLCFFALEIGSLLLELSPHGSDLVLVGVEGDDRQLGVTRQGVLDLGWVLDEDPVPKPQPNPACSAHGSWSGHSQRPQ